MALNLIITNAGRAALVNAAGDGTNAVRIASVGLTATAFTPAITTAAIPNEIKRVATISGDVIGPNIIHLVMRDETADTFTVRGFGLYLQDGTLFAVYAQAGVILEKSASALMLLAIDVTFVDVSATSVTFGNANFLNPPATETRQGVVELATIAEVQAGADTVRAITPATLAASLSALFGQVWRASNDGAGSGLDADLLDGLDSSAFARLIGAVFTGQVSATVFQVASNAYFTISGGNPVLNFDPNDYMFFSRSANVLAVAIGGATQFAINADGWVDAVNGIRIANAVAWHAANDGAGSGLDADLLDGQQGSWYADIPARLGYTPISRGGGIGQLNNFIYMGWSGTRLKVTVDGSDLGPVVFDSQVADVWRASNDGAGSGLDADLLRGQPPSAFAAAIPGQIATFAMAAAPAGYLVCDGRSLARAVYPALFAAIGTIYGTADGNSFNIPDLRGEFIRGFDGGRGIDPGRAFGSTQSDELRSHTHGLFGGNVEGDTFNSSTNGNNSSLNIETKSTGGAETRPRNVALLICIKY